MTMTTYCYWDKYGPMRLAGLACMVFKSNNAHCRCWGFIDIDTTKLSVLINLALLKEAIYMVSIDRKLKLHIKNTKKMKIEEYLVAVYRASVKVIEGKI